MNLAEAVDIDLTRYMRAWDDNQAQDEREARAAESLRTEAQTLFADPAAKATQTSFDGCTGGVMFGELMFNTRGVDGPALMGRVLHALHAAQSGNPLAGHQAQRVLVEIADLWVKECADEVAA